MKMHYLPPEYIERRACALIGKYEERYGPISTPVPIEKIAEHILDLTLEWNEIPESPREVIFAGLDPKQKKVVFNEKRRSDYESGGLYNTVLAHEIGHWVLHVDAVDLGLQPMLLGTGIDSRFIYRKTGPSTPVEWQAHTFMSYLTMPYKLLRNYIETEDLCDWSSLYYLRDKFDITISALTIRLKKMGLIFIDDKKIYPGEASYRGQIKLV